MIKVGLSTRNRYITSEMGATALAPVTHRPFCEDGSNAVQVPSDWLRPLDRGPRCPQCGAEVGGREAAEAGLASSVTGPSELAAA